MDQPEGFIVSGKVDLVCKLKKVLIRFETVSSSMV